MRRLLSCTLLLLALSLPVAAREVAGVALPETLSLHNDATPLALNGAGVRRKFFFKIYVGALYLPRRATTAEAVFAQTGPKRVRMVFLYDTVSREKLAEGWNDGFAANQDSAALTRLRARLDRFNALFPDLRRGDVVDLDYLPARETTEVWINNVLAGSIDGADFNRALLAVWLGAEPADETLRAALLGGSERD